MSAGSSERDLSTPQTPNPKPGQAFRGKGKKSVWQAWHAYQDVTETFVHIAEHPFLQLDTDSNNFQLLERLIVVLYDKSSPLTSVNEIRQDLLCQRNISMDRLPPTQNALLQHLRRGVYTRQESGQPAQKLNKWFLPPKILAGLRSLEYGCLFG